ncbi:MAG: type I methionyl aminopeptidase [Gammaproteobacteria bacterium]|nr:type I methionyl aminopeptidase [Gammaproteobacteria bacterium]
MNAKTRNHVDGLKASGQAVRAAFDAMVKATKAGMTTAELDGIGAQVLAEYGAKSAPQLYYEFPGATCISVNEEAAHGIPGNRTVCDGDMINIDVSANLNGYVADMGQSFVVGAGNAEQLRLCAAVQRAVRDAIVKVRSGRSLNVIGKAVQQVADREGYTIVQNLGSHGVGRNIHEEPSYVPFDNPQETRTLDRGMVLTIEPFFTTGAAWVNEQDDGWTLTVPQGQMVAQYEHTLIVTDNGAIVVTE